MTVASYKLDLTNSAYTLVAGGNTTNTVGVMLDSGLKARIIIGSNVGPSNTAVNYFVLGNGNDRSFSIDLDAASYVYAMGHVGNTTIRGYTKV